MRPDIVIIPAAGFGTRMRRISETFGPDFPKELLPVLGRPAIQHTLLGAREAGVKRVAVITRPGKESLRDYLTSSLARERIVPHRPDVREEMARLAVDLDISFFTQPEPLGECDAISLCRDIAGRAPFLVSYPDNLCPPGVPALKVLADALASCPGHLAALMEATPDNAECLGNSGRVVLDPKDRGIFRIRAFLPKGDGPFPASEAPALRTCGMFAALPDFFEFIEAARPGLGRDELTDGRVRRLMLERGQAMYGIRMPGEIFDIGNPAGYERCRRILEGNPLTRAAEPAGRPISRPPRRRA